MAGANTHRRSLVLASLMVGSCAAAAWVTGSLGFAPSGFIAPELAALKNTIEAQRTLLRNLSVESEYTVTGGSESQVRYFRDRLVMDGTRFLYRSEWAVSADPGAQRFSRFVTFDGSKGVVGFGPGSAGSFESPEPLREWFVLPQSDFFAACAWYPSQQLTHQPQIDGDLSFVLGSGRASLRPDQETIGGHACAVADVKDASGSIVRTYWLALDRGALPIRQEFCRGGKATLVRTITDFLELPNGAWIPVAGATHVDPRPEMAETAAGSVREFRVLTAPDGGLSASIAPPPDSAFDPYQYLPPGSPIPPAPAS